MGVLPHHALERRLSSRCACKWNRLSRGKVDAREACSLFLALVPALRGLRAVRLLRLLRAASLFRYRTPFAGLARAGPGPGGAVSTFWST